jgi:GTP-binding protein
LRKKVETNENIRLHQANFADRIMKFSFIKSSADWKQCPEPDRPEIALIGRSNVGKSSLINAILENRSAAKISSTPGKTQVINHFLVEDLWYLVDLPGYGYARVSRSERNKWEKMVRDYFLKRENLVLLLLLIDSRIPPQKSDLEFAAFAGRNQIPLLMVFTKADKQSAGKSKAVMEAFSAEMEKQWESLPPMILSSAQTGLGRSDILLRMSEALDAYQPDTP